MAARRLETYRSPSSRVLPFDRRRKPPRVGRVHPDGSISYQGEHYETVRDLPQSCLAFRLDREAYQQWLRAYRAIAPRRRSM